VNPIEAMAILLWRNIEIPSDGSDTGHSLVDECPDDDDRQNKLLFYIGGIHGSLRTGAEQRENNINYEYRITA